MRHYLIAEIGLSHDGSLGFAHSYIDKLSRYDIDAIKFQMHIPEAESSEFESFRVQFSRQDVTRYDYWSRTSFNYAQWVELKKHTEDVGLDFICTPFSLAAVDLLEKMNVRSYKVGSGDTNNSLLIDKLIQTGKKIILSSGMSNYEELKNTVDYVLSKKREVALLHCTSKYPTPYEEVGINNISEFKKKFGVKIGLSDHSGEIFPILAAQILGSEISEFHVVYDKSQFGPDSMASLTYEQLEILVAGVRANEVMLKSSVNKDVLDFKKMRELFGRTLAINRDIRAGEILTLDDLETKKPRGYGICVEEYNNILGKTVKRDLNKWSYLKYDDLI